MMVAAGCAAPVQYREVAVPAGMRREARDEALDAAVALAAEGRYAEAAARFSGLVERYEAAGDGTHLAEGLFWLGYCREKLGCPAEARQLYGRVLRQYPDQPAARQARQRLAGLPPG
jgi:TolA-binding protein